MRIARPWWRKANQMARSSRIDADHQTAALNERAQVSDARRIIIARGLRSFAYGMLAVVLGVWLAREGFSPVAIGALVTISLLGDFAGTYLIGLRADSWGRRRTLAALALLMGLTGLAVGFLTSYPALALVAFVGTLGASASETAPFLPIEQAILPQISAPAQRTRVFARYNFVASLAGALGALAAGLPDLLARAGAPLLLGFRALFVIYALAALTVLALALSLSPAVEPESRPARAERTRARFLPRLPQSSGVVYRLAGLFSLDALAGGLIVQSLLALYFHQRFGASLGALAALFFGANLLSALSFLAAPMLARRFGLLNTMVFTHLPSSLLLALIPLAPTFPIAATLLLARQMLSQMDVPTRQAYTMELVAPEERAAAASVTSLARSAGSATSPVLSGLLLQGPLLALGLPLALAGGVKAGYDLALWRLFRHVPLRSSS
jgi:MFS family permease